MVEGLSLPTGSLARLRSSLRTSLFRNSFFLLLSSAFGSGLGFLFWLAVAQSYPAADVGRAATVFGVVLFLAGAGSLGLPYGIIRFLPSEADKASLVKAALVASGVASGILGLLFLMGLSLWSPPLAFLQSDPALAAACVLSVVGFALGIVLDATFVASRRAGFGTIRTVTFGATRLPIPLLLAGSFGILGVFLAWSAALFVSLIVGAFVLLPRVATGYRALPSAEAPRAKGIFRYSLWNHATAITAAIPLSLLPLVILNSPEPTGGAEASAFFFAAAAIGGVIYVVPYAFTTSLFVEGSHPEASFARDTRHAIGFSVAFLVTGVLVAVALGRWILRFFGPAYSGAGYESLVILALASPLVLANNVFMTRLRVSKRVRPLFVIVAATSAASIVLAYAFLPMWGIAGAAAAFGLGQAFTAPLFALETKWNGSKGTTS